MRTYLHARLVASCMLAVLAVTAKAAAAPPESGTSFCAREAPEHACRIGWQWRDEPRALQWLQRFDPESRSWQGITALPSQRNGQYENAIEDGRLYRVVACDDESGSVNCIYSTMTWAALRPATVNDIPKWVVPPRGTLTHVYKNGSYRDEVMMFNFVKMMAHLEGIEWSTLPAMTEVSREAARADTWAAVDRMLYQNFMPARSEPVSLESPPPLSPERLTQLRRSEIARLDESSMILFEPAQTKHTVTVFMDVQCRHCARMYRDMEAINALGIRVRWLAYPQVGPDTRAWRDTESVWCATDRRVAVGKAFAGESLPPASCDSEAVIQQYALAKSLQVPGSPFIINGRGEALGGYVSPQALLGQLDAVVAKK